LDGILKFKRAVTVAALSYIKYMEHFRSHAKKKEHQVLGTVGSTDSHPCTSSRGIEEKRKNRRKKLCLGRKHYRETEDGGRGREAVIELNCCIFYFILLCKCSV